MEYLLVDGYNIINAWKDVFNLLAMLSNYEGYKKVKIIVVFDAHLVSGGKEKVENYDNIIIVYTGENQTADNYIERFVYKYSNENIIRVVTSDYLEQSIVLRNGGARMTPRELRKEIDDARKNMRKDSQAKQHNTRNTVISNIKPEIVEILEKLRRDSLEA
jgi:predicted RNA-binding protein with PIN domain